jgi:RNA polymerase primary sigma factor
MFTSTVSNGLGWYLDRIKETPLLTAQQERQLSRRIREHGDPMAREQMIQANLRLVVKISKGYVNNGMSINDLVAEIPDYLSKLILRWRRATSKLEADFGRPPTVEEIADYLHVSEKKADIVTQGISAIHTPSQASSDDGQTPAELIPDGHTQAPDQHLMDESVQPLVESILERLDHRSREILNLRYGLDGYEGPQRTYKQIGKIMGLTRERVRQLEKRAMTDLKVTFDELM